MEWQVPAKKWFAGIIALLLVVDAAVLVDIPVLRPVLGFLFFTTIPGLLVLYNLKLNEIDFLKKLLLSVGLSLSFLIFVGLLVNTLLFRLGYRTPLSTTSLVISFSLAIVILCSGAYWRNRKGIRLTFLHDLAGDLKGKRLSLLLLPVLFPILTIIGRKIIDTGGSNAILVALYTFIPLYIILVMWQHRNVPKMTYPLATGMISISILLSRSLISNYVIGGDILSEYHSFQVVSQNLHWSMDLERSNSSASLSVSLLPAVFQSIMGINPVYIFKVVMLVPISLIPVVCYMMYERYIENPNRFLSSFFYMAQLPFIFLLTGQIRVGIALISFALAVTVLFDDHISGLNKRVLFLVFLFSMVVEYYALPVFFLAMTVILYLVPRIWKTRFGIQSLSLESAIMLPVALIFLWWGQITATAIYQYVYYGAHIVANLSNLFVAELRGGEISALYTPATNLPIIAQVPGWVQRFTFLAIAIGVVSILARKEHRLRFGSFSVLMAACLAILVAFIVLPWISLGYGSDRIYMQPLVVLAPAFVVGCREISNGIRAAWVYSARLVKFIVPGHYLRPIQSKSLLPILIGVILVLQFFSSSYLYHQLFYPVYKVYTREVLDPNSNIYAQAYVYDSEVQAAIWLGASSSEPMTVFFGNIRQRNSREIFEYTDYGVGKDFTILTFPIIKEKPELDSYVFLDHINLIGGDVIGFGSKMGSGFSYINPLSDYTYFYDDKNKIYANIKTEIYR